MYSISGVYVSGPINFFRYSFNLIFTDTVSFSVLLARQISQAMVIPLAKRANAASDAGKQTHRAITRCPVTTLQHTCQWNNHCLQAAPCVETSCERCIRKYQVGGVLAVCCCNAHCACSRTNGNGSSRRACNASITAVVVGALPSPTARLRSHCS